MIVFLPHQSCTITTSPSNKHTHTSHLSFVLGLCAFASRVSISAIRLLWDVWLMYCCSNLGNEPGPCVRQESVLWWIVPVAYVSHAVPHIPLCLQLVMGYYAPWIESDDEEHLKFESKACIMCFGCSRKHNVMFVNRPVIRAVMPVMMPSQHDK